MIRRIIKTIHYLRVYFFAFILVGFFFYVGANPVSVGKFIGAKFSRAVGMSVSVPENPFNKLALQLKEKEDRLNNMESELNQREIEMAKNASSSQAKLIIGMGAGLILLFILIALNFYLDYRRRQQSKLTFKK